MPTWSIWPLESPRSPNDLPTMLSPFCSLVRPAFSATTELWTTLEC